MTDLEILLNNMPQTPDQLSNHYYGLTEKYWSDINNNNDLLQSTDNQGLYDFQSELLNSVIQIHHQEKETDKHIKSILDQTLHVKSLRGKLRAKTSHDGLYYFNEVCHYFFVGDLHSDSFIIRPILEKIDFFSRVISKEPFKIIFLGDYVDRGHHHLKTLQNLMLLKILFPQHIYLLMGNHDIGNIYKGEVTLYLRKMEKDLDYFYIYINRLHQNHIHFSDELLDLYLGFMNTLNVAAFIITDALVVKAVHGGIPRPDVNDQFDYLKTLNMLTDQTLDPQGHRIRDCIIWSDPSSLEPTPLLPGRRFKFYEKQLDAYTNHIGIDMIIRGHQAIEDGHVAFFGDKIHTIFSSGYVLENGENINQDTAYKKVSPKLLSLEKNTSTMTPIDIN